MARTWFDRLPLLITRPFNYVGRGQGAQFLVPKLVDHFRRRAPVVQLGSLNVEREFLDVRTVAEVYVRLLEAPLQSEVLNIASGVGRTLRSIIDDLTRITGHRIGTEVNSALVRNNEVARLVGSSQRLQQVVGALSHMDFEETLRWMLESPPQPA
jgi:GDP-6-deoxy-D-talose 4-dehydrogenase